MSVFISRENFAKLGVTPTQTSKTLILAGTEYTVTIPAKTKRIIIGMQSGSNQFFYGWNTGEVLFPVPAGAFRDISDIHIDETTLYLRCDDASGEVIIIEYWL